MPKLKFLPFARYAVFWVTLITFAFATGLDLLAPIQKLNTEEAILWGIVVLLLPVYPIFVSKSAKLETIGAKSYAKLIYIYVLTATFIALAFVQFEFSTLLQSGVFLLWQVFFLIICIQSAKNLRAQNSGYFDWLILTIGLLFWVVCFFWIEQRVRKLQAEW